MKKLGITILIMFLACAGFLNGCSGERAKEQPKGMTEKKSLVEKSFETEPKAPASALEGVEEGSLMEEEHASSFE